MTDKEKKERESTILEIQSRKVVLEKIENALFFLWMESAI